MSGIYHTNALCLSIQSKQAFNLTSSLYISRRDFMNKFYEKLNIARQRLSGFLKDVNTNNKGMGVIEIVLIILVLVGLVIIFRNQITAIITNVFSKVAKEINGF